VHNTHMRRVVLIAGVVAIVMIVLLAFGLTRADANAPFDPIRPYVVHRQTYFVEEMHAPGQQVTVLWLKGDDMRVRLAQYFDWLSKERGWLIVKSIVDVNKRAYNGGSILPTETISIDRADNERYKVTYTKELGRWDALLSRIRYHQQRLGDGPMQLDPVGW